MHIRTSATNGLLIVLQYITRSRLTVHGLMSDDDAAVSHMILRAQIKACFGPFDVTARDSRALISRISDSTATWKMSYSKRI
jgi:hypothetical protein